MKTTSRFRAYFTTARTVRLGSLTRCCIEPLETVFVERRSASTYTFRIELPDRGSSLYTQEVQREWRSAHVGEVRPPLRKVCIVDDDAHAGSLAERIQKQADTWFPARPQDALNVNRIGYLAVFVDQRFARRARGLAILKDILSRPLLPVSSTRRRPWPTSAVRPTTRAHCGTVKVQIAGPET